MKNHVNSHAALMAAILEQAGHLSEYLESVEFSDCCKYVLYTFTTNQNEIIVNAITKSSEVHMNQLSTNGIPRVTDNSWIKHISNKTIYDDIKNAKHAWSSWNPEHDIACMLKSSFDEIF
jgi:cell division protein FtsI/penicillin-binding protein 2